MGDDALVVVLLGPPGVGKGTQGALLAEALGWEHLATGDVLRAARREGSALGAKVQGFMDRGDLVPDDLIVEVVNERVGKIPGDRGIVFDGFPRTVGQAEALGANLPVVGRKVDAVILLEAEDDVLVKRIAGRRSCATCGRIYNVHFDPPRQDGVCDECGSALLQRPDDVPETVRHRLEVYRMQTEPLVSFYEGGGAPLLRVDGSGELETVQTEIAAAVSGLSKGSQ
jgi:adenylate kinase